ncbi:hypothetical protein, partial [Amycolatopsis vancoresmycina]
AAVAWARRLRDDGAEVVHAGPLDTAEQILRTAEQEDPDAVGVLGAAPPEGLEAALGDVVLFTAETAAKTLESLSGGRSHTTGAPSDRAR